MLSFRLDDALKRLLHASSVCFLSFCCCHPALPFMLSLPKALAINHVNN
jgi:hypothetical protein